MLARAVIQERAENLRPFHAVVLGGHESRKWVRAAESLQCWSNNIDDTFGVYAPTPQVFVVRDLDCSRMRAVEYAAQA